MIWSYALITALVQTVAAAICASSATERGNDVLRVTRQARGEARGRVWVS